MNLESYNEKLPPLIDHSIYTILLNQWEVWLTIACPFVRMKTEIVVILHCQHNVLCNLISQLCNNCILKNLCNATYMINQQFFICCDLTHRDIKHYFKVQFLPSAACKWWYKGFGAVWVSRWINPCTTKCMWQRTGCTKYREVYRSIEKYREV